MLFYTNGIVGQGFNNARTILLNTLALFIQFENTVIAVNSVEYVCSVEVCKIRHYYGQWIADCMHLIMLLFQIVGFSTAMLSLNFDCPFCEVLIINIVDKHILRYDVVIRTVHSNILDFDKLIIAVIVELGSFWVHIIGSIVNCDVFSNGMVYDESAKCINKVVLRWVEWMGVQLS